MKQKPIPEPTDELKKLCDADNQFSNFERVFRSVIAVPKTEVLKRETKEMHRNARKRARKKRSTK